ncbi:MAG: hypothetical protein GX921_01085 [Bacteroidales bacterium]|nr:hypothetical protein [Bacteroidales bacterium]
MCEYLEKLDEFERVTAPFEVDTLKGKITPEEYVRAVIAFKDDVVMPLIPKDVREDLELNDYEIYTDKHHHRQYWNEIPLPMIALNFVDEYKKIADLNHTEESKYCAVIYDLSDDEFCFNTLEEMETFLRVEDVAPFTAFELVGLESFNGMTAYELRELYSA